MILLPLKMQPCVKHSHFSILHFVFREIHQHKQIQTTNNQTKQKIKVQPLLLRVLFATFGRHFGNWSVTLNTTPVSRQTILFCTTRQLGTAGICSTFLTTIGNLQVMAPECRIYAGTCSGDRGDAFVMWWNANLSRGYQFLFLGFYRQNSFSIVNVKRAMFFEA